MRHMARQLVFDCVFEFQSSCVGATFVWFNAWALERGLITRSVSPVMI